MSQWKKFALVAAVMLVPATAWSAYQLGAERGCPMNGACKCGSDCKCGPDCKCGDGCKCGDAAGHPHHG